jgi:hypothetical protein
MKFHLVEETISARLDALAETLPVDTDSGWNEVVEQHVARRNHVTATLMKAEETGTTPRRYRRLAFLGMAAAVVVAAAAVGILSIGTRPASGTPALPEPLAFARGSHQAAVVMLERAAGLQQRASSRSGPVRYAKTQNYALQTDVGRHASTTTVETTIREVWVAPDGSALAKSSLQDTTRAGVAVGTPTAQLTDDRWQDGNADFPNSPTSMLAALLVGAGTTGDDRDLILAQSIMSHLSQGTATPQQVAGLYGLLGNLPGVFDAGTVTDNAGRTGNAVGILTGNFDSGTTCLPETGASGQMAAMLARNHVLGQGITYLVFDPTTGQPLQIEAVDTPNAPCGLDLPPQPTIEQYNVILQTGRVAQLGAKLP